MMICFWGHISPSLTEATFPSEKQPCLPEPLFTHSGDSLYQLPSALTVSRTIVSAAPGMMGLSHFQSQPGSGGELLGSAEGKGDSKFILNPSGH